MFNPSWRGLPLTASSQVSLNILRRLPAHRIGIHVRKTPWLRSDFSQFILTSLYEPIPRSSYGSHRYGFRKDRVFAPHPFTILHVCTSTMTPQIVQWCKSVLVLSWKCIFITSHWSPIHMNVCRRWSSGRHPDSQKQRNIIFFTASVAFCGKHICKLNIILAPNLCLNAMKSKMNLG